MNMNGLFSLILDTDSYKASHWTQYPKDTEYVKAYIESRGGEHHKTMVFGFQYLYKEYLTKRITKEEVDFAAKLFAHHGLPFNYDGWMYIVNELDGKLPIIISNVAEGCRIPVKNVIATIRNTDPKCYWLTNYIETMLLRIWYPITVATKSLKLKETIYPFCKETSDNPEADLAFKVHDFGSRGTTCREQSMIGGMAHLVNFDGTDTVSAVYGVAKYYNNGEFNYGYSIPASEHSTITSWGKDKEKEAYSNMIDAYKDNMAFACVSDSYDIYNATDKIWTTELKDKIMNMNANLVIRPDSGDPVQVVLDLIQIVDKNMGSTLNSKGYKVLNKVRIIQGDGININTVKEILIRLKEMGFASDNVNFGIGGALLQKDINRDTQMFATKCCAIKLKGDEVWRDVYKQPIDAPFKKSKKGNLTLSIQKSLNGDFYGVKTEVIPDYCVITEGEFFPITFLNGEIRKEFTFEEVRKNTDIIFRQA